MWSCFALFGLCCLAAVSYTASDKIENVDSAELILGKSNKDQPGKISAEKYSFDNTTPGLKDRKELIQEPTESKLTEKESVSLPQGVRQPSTDSGAQPNDSLKEHAKDNSVDPYAENDKTAENEDVCFAQLGCFKMGKPWKSVLRPIKTPESPEKIHTTIHFYSRQNVEEPMFIFLYPKINLGRAKFNSTKKSVVIVHGFSSSGNATWMKNTKNAYLKEVDTNIMIVDWEAGARRTSYLQVAGNTRVVGKQLALFVQYLIKNFGADPSRFHLIGHSLGAQIISYLAKEVQGIGRLTALDPAQPGFEGFEKEVRLDKTDADFVDVIHTDAKPFIPTLGFGMISPEGHVDFYINGGYGQPGCIYPQKNNIPVINSLSDLAKYTVETLSDWVSCSHGRAYEYFVEALNHTKECTFWGHKADPKNIFKSVTNTLTQGLLKEITALSPTCSEHDCVPLGFETGMSPLRGIFVVTTNQKKPYCISEDPQKSKSIKLFDTIKENSKLLRNIQTN